MPEYVPLGLIETSRTPDELSALAFASLTTNVTGWNPTEGKLEARLIEAIALMAAEVSVLIGAVPSAIFRYFGRTILELASIDASFASVTATVTMTSNAGWTLPAGTAFGLRRTGDQLYAFVTAADLVVPAGATVGTVTLIAVDAGALSSGLAGPVEPIDAITYVQSITIPGFTTGGVDAETDTVYQGRLRDELTLLAPRLILPKDGEVFARRIAGVDRALAIDLLDPIAGTTNNARTTTYAVRDINGEAVSSLTKLAVDADLQAKREVNFVIHVIDGTYSTIDVAYAAVAYPTFATADVQTKATAALTAYLSPKDWGQPPVGQLRTWVQQPIVRYTELVAVLNNVEGVNYLTALTFGVRKMVTAVAATDVFTVTAHGFIADQPVRFASLVGGAPLVAGTTYYARTITANTFQVAATVGGAAIDTTTDLTAGTVAGLATADVTMSGYAPLPRPGLITGTITGS